MEKLKQAWNLLDAADSVWSKVGYALLPLGGVGGGATMLSNLTLPPWVIGVGIMTVCWTLASAFLLIGARGKKLAQRDEELAQRDDELAQQDEELAQRDDELQQRTADLIADVMKMFEQTADRDLTEKRLRLIEERLGIRLPKPFREDR